MGGFTMALPQEDTVLQSRNKLKADMKLPSNDPNLIDRKKLPPDLQSTYDMITAFLNGMKKIRDVMPSAA